MLIVGMGNPGSEYALTRHNVGFMVVDAWAAKRRATWTQPSSLYAEASLRVAGKRLALIKPLTYMNASGKAVKKALNAHRLTPSQCVIIVDEYNFPVGRVNLRQRGSDGGHNGVTSVIQELGTEEFWRLRLGIGRDFGPGQLVDYVLGEFPRDQHELVRKMVDAAVTELENMVSSQR